MNSLKLAHDFGSNFKMTKALSNGKSQICHLVAKEDFVSYF